MTNVTVPNFASISATNDLLIRYPGNRTWTIINRVCDPFTAFSFCLFNILLNRIKNVINGIVIKSGYLFDPSVAHLYNSSSKCFLVSTVMALNFVRSFLKLRPLYTRCLCTKRIYLVRFYNCMSTDFFRYSIKHNSYSRLEISVQK